MTEAHARRTFEITCQGEGDNEVQVSISGTRAEFDTTSARLVIFDGDEPVGGFIRILRWFRKNS